ncbi:zinc finger CCCH domain-containing protein 5 [Phtheirospermum japonicum]|uniref:Zinc finger CCCH domain-containing protein 5 n=1 Tax=Phtheirospermum japonicum TaxID=374723 RepID=A0A830CBK6_9LAMI|nr:zinc finger CCCH domain-containing protein 5 [Phtheirospermum japonicum]
MGEEEIAEDNNNNNTNTNTEAAEREVAGRKERRKAAKKEKRKQKRKEMAETARREEETRLNDPEEQLRLQAEEEQEKARVERERMEFEERERKILEEWERKRAEDQREEDERRIRAQEDEYQLKQNQGNEADEDGWEYVEEGPPEIIWQGNEIIVKKKKIRVKKKDADQLITKEDPNRPTSNPLPPQSEFLADYKNTSVLSAQQILETVAEETPNFGTEQDKAHCPFHLKTGACRFGSRCSRIHFYPDKSCIFLIKNMYNGPGLAWEQDEGLEHTDEEVEHAYEEFYEDVHTEFLKFGEIVNFKVCRNGSPHLRGNVYVHYKSLDSAVVAYQTVNGRYFAGKQVQCEFVGVTRWKVAICGEFMKSKLQACSRGTACNFIHCFRNPGGDYEWADWDKPAPRYWVKKIYHYRRSRSREISYSRSSRNYSDGDDDDSRSSERRRRHTTADRKHPEILDGKQWDDASKSREKPYSKNGKSESQGGKSNRTSVHEIDSDENMHHRYRDNYTRRHSSRSQRHRDKASTSSDDRSSDDEERENARICRSENPKNHGRSYRSSDSRSRSRKDTGETDRGGCEKEVSDHLKKKSRRKRETGERDVSESRIESRKAKRSHVTDYRIDEATDDRGRWEPSIGDFADDV